MQAPTISPAPDAFATGDILRAGACSDQAELALAARELPSAHRDIVQGLRQPLANIAPKYFYDRVGSALFERITRLPEYYPTRTEQGIMCRHGADMAHALGPQTSVIELGAGNCEKARELCQQMQPTHFVAVDISSEFLHQAVAQLRAALPTLDVRAVAADLTA